MSIANQLLSVKNQLPENVTLVAVSKTKSEELIMEAYNAGQRIFGENKVQELEKKYQSLPKDIQWHMIGHMQTNKVKYIASFVTLIHGVDSIKLLHIINKEGLKNNRRIPCLLQVHIAKEETKYGFSKAELNEFLNSEDYRALKWVQICGLMGMATFTNDESLIISEFRMLSAIFKELKNTKFSDEPYFKELSMGMSDDYHLAIDEGSTMVRIGSLIFGERYKL
ncbi:MAG: YggS family pyridoxal phosphate-dependent enzyme [Marinilabiliaceae bacterium]|nr:YggS family pyridoxal phosphate-dependent enzyme [Marinilabiliaceae bacterium]